MLRGDLSQWQYGWKMLCQGQCGQDVTTKAASFFYLLVRAQLLQNQGCILSTLPGDTSHYAPSEQLVSVRITAHQTKRKESNATATSS